MPGVEILGIATSVLSIADLGARLSMKLFTFAKAVNAADKQIDILSRDIAATGAVLFQLGNELETDNSRNSCSEKAIGTAQELVQECKVLFNELNSALDGNNDKYGFIPSFKRKVKWPYLEPHLQLLRTTLERL